MMTDPVFHVAGLRPHSCDPDDVPPSSVLDLRRKQKWGVEWRQKEARDKIRPGWEGRGKSLARVINTWLTAGSSLENIVAGDPEGGRPIRKPPSLLVLRQTVHRRLNISRAAGVENQTRS